MLIVNPLVLTTGMLLSSTAALSSYASWSAGTAYTIGQFVTYNNKDWKAAAGSTGVTPGTDPTKWVDQGYSNRYKFMDQSVSTQVSGTTSIVMQLSVPSIYNSISFFGLKGATITVKVSTLSEGVVYERTTNLIDNSAISSWYSWFFEPIEYTTDLVLTDLPSYSNTTLEVTISASTGTEVLIGEMVVGTKRKIGLTQYGTQVGIRDYSKKEIDEFGNFVIVKRNYAKRVDFDVAIETSKVSAIQQIFSKLRTTPTVFIGNEEIQSTIIYGFYKEFAISISTPSYSEGTIEVEGLT